MSLSSLTPQERAKNSLLKLGYKLVSSLPAQLHTNLANPLPWQIPVLEDRSPLLLLTGSAGGGKSRLGLELLHRYMQRYPGSTGVMMRKAREWTDKSIVAFMKQTVIGESGKHIAQYLEGKKIFRYANGSHLYVGGMMDAKQRESVRSIGGDGGLGIILFEEANAFTEEDYNEIIGRVRSPIGEYRQKILMTNPDAPNHWINKRFIVGGEAKVYYSGAKDNPNNSSDYLEELEKMTGILYERLVLGRWVQAEGVIYDNFSPEFNVTTDAEYIPGKPVIWGVDDGYARGTGAGSASYHPRVVLLGQKDGRGGVNIFHAYYQTGELGERTIQNVFELNYAKPDAAYIDSSAVELKQRIWNEGINTVGSTHTVSEGIKNVRRLICDGAGVRLLKIHPRCSELINELQSYRYDPDSTTVQIGEPKPLKLDDHGPDALRYMTWHLRYD